MQKVHLQQAKDRGAFILDFGDFFDAMQGKGDKRSSKLDLMARFVAKHGKLDDEEELEKSYLNALVDYGADFLNPYGKNIALIGEGNHESAIKNHLEYNLHDGLIRELNRIGHTHIIKGGYRGWIIFRFEHSAGGKRSSKNLYYTHGYGGGGPVTKDIIQSNRKAVYLSNADFVVSGHTHDQWYFPIERTRLTMAGIEVRDTQYHIKIPSYKDEFFNTPGGWANEKGMPPKPTGAWWMRFYWSTRTERIETQMIAAEV